VTLLELLGSRLPVVAAPMAGGPSTPALVAAATAAGSAGFLAGGYLSAQALADQVRAVREAGAERYGVNLFAPSPVPVDRAAYAAYRLALLPLAERFGVELPEAPREDDDGWHDKVDVLVAAAPPVVSFTFGLPDGSSVAALRRAGCALVQTVTSVEEARQAARAGVDGLAVQARGAGGHWGTFTPQRPPDAPDLPTLVRAVRAALPGLALLAAGGTGGPDDVRAALAADAQGVAVGTLLLRTPEAGTNAAHRAGLVGDRGAPVSTHAFSGRPAGALRNAFLAAYDGRGPLGYPALHHLTAPIRRAAAAAGDPEHVNLWAGTGYRHATERPAGEVLRELAD
jgi:nitronate monooxygenase